MPPEQIQQILRPWADNCGHRNRPSAPSASQGGQRSRSPHSARIATTRCRVTQRCVSAIASTTTCAPGFHRERDGRANHASGRANSLTTGRLGGAARRVLDTPAAPSVSFGDDPCGCCERAFRVATGFYRRATGPCGHRRDGPQLARISVERVAAELDKLVRGHDPSPVSIWWCRPDG